VIETFDPAGIGEHRKELVRIPSFLVEERKELVHIPSFLVEEYKEPVRIVLEDIDSSFLAEEHKLVVHMVLEGIGPSFLAEEHNLAVRRVLVEHQALAEIQDLVGLLQKLLIVAGLPCQLGLSILVQVLRLIGKDLVGGQCRVVRRK
jgi:hypothetical protein